jgi:hypothetical protein
MRPLTAVCLSLLALMGVLPLACRSAPAPELPPAPETSAPGRAGVFSADRAWKHLEALAAIGPRAVGTPGAAKARVYIENELESLGLEAVQRSTTVNFDSDDFPDLELVNLEAAIPGDSPDLIVLAAPYDSAYRESYEYLGVNDGASGTALLLEIARVLVADPLPYTVRLYFLDGEATLGRGGATDAEAHLLGSMAAASRLQSSQQLTAVRLLLVLNRVSDADLHIARDRFSHRIYRDAIWQAAAELGYTDAFSEEAGFDAPVAGHRSFVDAGIRRSVAIVDPRFGGEELPGLAEYAEDDTLERSSPRSLEIVGRVTLAALESISARLAKIDRFSRNPVAAEPELPAADAGVTPMPEEGADAAPQEPAAAERTNETAEP